MKSHAVPRKLLEQFAYDDPVTRSKRLWRYQKGRPPYGRAAPKTATRRDGHFADPANSTKEAELEERLKRKFEDRVNQFIDIIGYRTFTLTATHIRLLTGYITILFNRTRARRAASDGQSDIRIEALRALLSDDQRLSDLAAKQTTDMIDSGYQLRRMVTREEIIEGIKRQITRHTNDDEAQRSYVETMETMMALSDERMLNGHWCIVHTEPDKPFVIGDAPVVTWERTESNILMFGQGFARPNVEALLPVSPTACLHVLPLVERSRPVRTPAPEEVNIRQFCLASAASATTVYSSVILVLAWPAIWEVSMLLPPTSCRQVMFARRRECGPKPRKSQPSAAAAFLSALRTPESHIGRRLSSSCGKTQASGSWCARLAIQAR
jgi:Protein of unknown function (DUF4238)